MKSAPFTLISKGINLVTNKEDIVTRNKKKSEKEDHLILWICSLEPSPHRLGAQQFNTGK